MKKLLPSYFRSLERITCGVNLENVNCWNQKANNLSGSYLMLISGWDWPRWRQDLTGLPPKKLKGLQCFIVFELLEMIHQSLLKNLPTTPQPVKAWYPICMGKEGQPGIWLSEDGVHIGTNPEDFRPVENVCTQIGLLVLYSRCSTITTMWKGCRSEPGGLYFLAVDPS